ncbi:type IX secretion system ring protein PorN/GldN [Arcticibacterium luteifluviistationis]|uniref:Gliding motility protein GldN n=1 Tax=Arcticibacterium luteifluviistationis TaxID=1784714 RepID=A0A2Z4GCL4_9BACT|nr:gliding motility protein GldN [Arcticibacterium luteifluviistationis]AWV99042.1 gliding motility protein GldN [Arcticibacterium luteifluviistationis]
MRKIKSLAILTGLVISHMAVGQETSDNGMNPLSLRPIHESNVAYKVGLWRRVDLREKQNQPLFANNNEITKYLVEGVKSGILDAYSDDNLEERLTLDEFNERMFKRFEGGGLSQDELDAGFGTEETTSDDGWGETTSGGTDDGWGEETTTEDNSQNGTVTTTSTQAPADGYEMFANEFYLLELKEDWIFDRQRSRQYFDIQTISIKIPAEASNDGLEKNLATFKYKDLEHFFRNNPNAVWYNEANTAKHINLADAFELRLFHGRIVKKSNSLNRYLDEQYKSPKEALNKSQELEYELIEFEHNLWEF